MALRERTLTIIGLTMIGLLALTFVVSETILLTGYDQLEQQNVREGLQGALSVLSEELSNLDMTTHDWASWDDTYAFVRDGNADYIKSNLVDKTFIHSRLNLILFINSSGSIVFGKAYDLQNVKEMPVPESLKQQLSPQSPLLQHPFTNNSTRGLLLLREGVVLVASRPILTSEDEGPIRGTLIMGRYLDAKEATLLSETAHLPIVVHQLDDPQMPPDFQVASASLSQEAPTLTRPLSRDAIAGYALLNDVNGGSVLVLRVDMSREIYKQGQASVSYLLVSLLVVGLAFGTVTLLLLERLVLSPLSQLSSDVSHIGTSGDLSARVSLAERRDELSNLAGRINEMLEALDQSQLKMQESETLYRRITENMLDMVSETDELWIFRYASPSHRRILAYDPNDLIGRSILEFVHSEDQGRVLAAAMEGLKTHSSTVTQFRCRRADGEYVWLESVNNPLFDGNGKPQGSVIATRDVSLRRRAEEAMRTSELEYRTLFENVPHGVYQSTLEGKLLTANPALVHMLGYDSEEELLSLRSTHDLYVNPEDRETWIRRLDETGEVRDAEIILRRRDGTDITVLDNAHAVRDERGAILCYEGTLTDITERKLMEEQLRRSEEELRSIFDSSPDAISVTDLTGSIVECNQATLDLHGFKSKIEAIGKDSLAFIGAGDHERAIESMKRTVERGYDRNVEYALLTKDGREFPAEISVGVLRGGSGNPIGFVAITKDITERKRMEEKLAEYTEHLEELVEERTKELRDAERFATIGQVAAMVGHDLRNPLQALVNTLFLVEESWKNVPSAVLELEKKHGLDCMRFLGSMEEQVQYMNKIVSDLQDYSSPLKAELSETDLKSLVADTLSMISVPENVDVKIEVAQDAQRTMVDPTLMKRTFTNLITNAIQAMPDGGHLTVRVSRDNQATLISVEDTGQGISKENLDKVFVPLFTTKAKGQGFGLAACKRIVEAHGGTITLESTVGKGTTILVNIPNKRGAG